MNSLLRACRLGTALAILGALVLLAGSASAQSIGELNSQLAAIEGQLGSAESNPSTANEVVTKLDHLESLFAQIANSPKSDKTALAPAYDRLDSALNRMYEAYKKKKDDCIAQIDNGGQCDYTEPEQISLKALYPLSWLRFQGATTVYTGNEQMQKKLLNEAIDGFTESTLVLFDPNLQRENILGRAYCERELGKFDHSEYDKAIADFKSILQGGQNTAQYKAANQGLASTYMAMGKPAEAQKYASGLGSGGGALMFRLQTLFSAEQAIRDPAKRAAQHKEIVDTLKGTEGDTKNWAIAIAAVGKYVQNPVSEFGGSSDPFEKWLLANVLLAKKDDSGAAKYYVEAARASSKYAKGYREAAAIYYNQKRFDQVQALLNDIARSGGSDAQWAEYMKYKLPRQQWESSGMKNTQLEDQWVKAAQDYVAKSPGGAYASELRFRLGEREERLKHYVEAAKLYDAVTGNNDYSFAAKFGAATCSYLALVSASAASKDKTAPAVNVEELRQTALKDLRETIKMAPEAIRTAGNAAQKRYVQETKGRAIYMLVGLMQGQKGTNPQEVADLLNNYESQYPTMSAKYRDIEEWRIAALDQLGKYDQVEQDVKAIIERNRGNIANSDFIKELGLDFWKAAQDAQNRGDQKAYLANAKLTAAAYTYFEDMVQAGKIPAKNLTGTLSILGQSYMATGQEPKAETIFHQVVKADAASPDANAGLARIAQAKQDYKDAVTLWTNVENTAAESDPLWYEAKYEVAFIYSKQGNIQGACSKLASTRAEHPNLGSPEMKGRWDKLQRALCLGH
jgi:hypothetical protein